jgi:hypothetical protein
MSATVAFARSSREGSFENEHSMLGERENTIELIEKSEKINSLVKEQVQ